MGEVMEFQYGTVNALYGNYVVVPPDGSIDEAKAALLEQIKGLIDELAKDDRFWIVKEVVNDPLYRYPGIKSGSHTVGWKLVVPQLADKIDGSVPGGDEVCQRRLSL